MCRHLCLLLFILQATYTGFGDITADAVLCPTWSPPSPRCTLTQLAHAPGSILWYICCLLHATFLTAGHMLFDAPPAHSPPPA
jgi:hypothetical protein